MQPSRLQFNRNRLCGGRGGVLISCSGIILTFSFSHLDCDGHDLPVFLRGLHTQRRHDQTVRHVGGLDGVHGELQEDVPEEEGRAEVVFFSFRRSWCNKFVIYWYR